MEQEPWVVRSGRWLTKRRSLLFAPLFATVLVAARTARPLWGEVLLDATGVAMVWAGICLRLVAASYHESSHHAEPITAGPYAWIRHPLYVANFLLGMGIVTVGGWWPVLRAYVLFFVPIHAVIMRSEEVHLAFLYGQPYETYRRAVPAVLPWKPYAGRRYGQRSTFKLQKGQEFLKVAGYLAGIAGILVIKQVRSRCSLPEIPPMPPAVWIGCGVIAGLAILVRPKLRAPALRSLQTVLAVCAVLAMVVHLPGVWPHPAPPAFARR